MTIPRRPILIKSHSSPALIDTTTAVANTKALYSYNSCINQFAFPYHQNESKSKNLCEELHDYVDDMVKTTKARFFLWFVLAIIALSILVVSGLWWQAQSYQNIVALQNNTILNVTQQLNARDTALVVLRTNNEKALQEKDDLLQDITDLHIDYSALASNYTSLETKYIKQSMKYAEVKESYRELYEYCQNKNINNKKNKYGTMISQMMMNNDPTEQLGNLVTDMSLGLSLGTAFLVFFARNVGYHFE